MRSSSLVLLGSARCGLVRLALALALDRRGWRARKSLTAWLNDVWATARPGCHRQPAEDRPRAIRANQNPLRQREHLEALWLHAPPEAVRISERREQERIGTFEGNSALGAKSPASVRLAAQWLNEHAHDEPLPLLVVWEVLQVHQIRHRLRDP
ncbi:hypothetical protein DFJ74DRAFT_318042 [Hyaloraphidium curvatum]|nr:hypothetical protein DFJ74DRAFT_318042 [Hyaloraphidium curvatum]